MKKQIIIHIGHGKTGTSFIQSVLAQNHDLLKKNGVLYPFHPSFRLAAQGHISSGNLPVVHLPDGRSPNWLTERVLPTIGKHDTYDKYIFSSEHIFWHMGEFANAYTACRDDFDFLIILCVREPVSLLSSAWHQRVKRHGYTRSFDEFLKESGYACAHALTSARILDELDRLECSYKLFNYSSLGQSIGSAVLDAMGIGSLLENSDQSLVVNRSLTHAELQLVAFINAVLGASAGQAIADQLVNSLPFVVAEKPSISAESLQRLQANMQDCLSSINRRLEEGKRLGWRQVAEEHNTFYQLDVHQHVIAQNALLAWLEKNNNTKSSSASEDRSSFLTKKNDRLKKRLARLRNFKSKRKNSLFSKLERGMVRASRAFKRMQARIIRAQ